MGWFTGLPRWAQITLPVLAVAVVVLAVVVIVQDDEDEAVAPTTTTTSTTSTTVAPTTTTEAPTTTTTALAGKTVEQIAAEVRATTGQVQSGGTGTFVCDATGTVSKGQVVPCRWLDLYSAEGEQLQPYSVYVAILDDEGTWAAHGATSYRGTAAALEEWHNWIGTGLNCTDFLEAEVGVAYAEAPWFAPIHYFQSLVYYFLEDGSPLLDIDNNGIPCETLFPAEVVEDVWAGGWVT